MNDAVANGVRHDRGADLVPPSGEVKLRTENRRRFLVSCFYDFKKVSRISRQLVISMTSFVVFTLSRVTTFYRILSTVQLRRRTVCARSRGERARFRRFPCTIRPIEMLSLVRNIH